MKKLLGFLLAALALAPGGSTGMVLIRESVFQRDPQFCYHEDSAHIRIWQGSLGAGESLRVPLRFCTTDETSYGASIEGVLYAAAFDARRQSLGVQIVFPDGGVRPARVKSPGQLWGCVVPGVDAENRFHYPFLEGGTYQVVLTNTGTKAISSRDPVTFEVRVDVADYNFQTSLCPVEDQDIRPVGS